MVMVEVKRVMVVKNCILMVLVLKSEGFKFKRVNVVEEIVDERVDVDEEKRIMVLEMVIFIF